MLKVENCITLAIASQFISLIAAMANTGVIGCGGRGQSTGAAQAFAT